MMFGGEVWSCVWTFVFGIFSAKERRHCATNRICSCRKTALSNVCVTTLFGDHVASRRQINVLLSLCFDEEWRALATQLVLLTDAFR